MFRGTILEFVSENGIGVSEFSRYMLAESFEDGFVFQIICLSGYQVGSINGYIKEDILLHNTHKAVTSKHLIKEIKRNFLNVVDDTIKIHPAE